MWLCTRCYARLTQGFMARWYGLPKWMGRCSLCKQEHALCVRVRG